MNYSLIVTIPILIVGIFVVVSTVRVLLGRLEFGSIRALMLFILVSLILISLWLYVTRDEQVFMSNISILADVFKHRLETITHAELILLVILGAILFKKMS